MQNARKGVLLVGTIGYTVVTDAINIFTTCDYKDIFLFHAMYLPVESCGCIPVVFPLNSGEWIGLFLGKRPKIVGKGYSSDLLLNNGISCLLTFH